MDSERRILGNNMENGNNCYSNFEFFLRIIEPKKFIEDFDCLANRVIYSTLFIYLFDKSDGG